VFPFLIAGAIRCWLWLTVTIYTIPVRPCVLLWSWLELKPGPKPAKSESARRCRSLRLRVILECDDMCDVMCDVCVWMWIYDICGSSVSLGFGFGHKSRDHWPLALCIAQRRNGNDAQRPLPLNNFYINNSVN